jgi:hypothetical protein
MLWTLENLLLLFVIFCFLQDSSWKFKLLTEYLGELSLLEYECLMLLPSLVAASITLLARFIVWPEKRPCWVSILYIKKIICRWNVSI